MLNFSTNKLTTLILVFLAVFVLIPVVVYAEDGMAHEGETTMAREKTIYFPQFQPVQSVVNEPYTIYTLQGKLALSDECLRIMSGDKAYLLIWPGWYTFDIIGRDIVVTHLRTGSVVAQLKLGNMIALSGGELEDRPFDLQYSIPDQCKGPYWAVGDIEPTPVKSEKQPMAGFYRPDRDQGAVVPAKPAKPKATKPEALPKPGFSHLGKVPYKSLLRPKKPVYPKQEPKKPTMPLPKPIEEPSEEELEKSIVR